MKKRVIICSLVLVVFLAGCSNIPYFGKQDKLSIGRGLKLYFGEGAPSLDRILVSSDGSAKFIVRVGVDNHGDPVNGELKIWDNIPGDKLESSELRKVGGGDNSFIDGAEIRYDDYGNIRATFPSKNSFTTGLIGYTKDEIVPGTQLNIFAELTIPTYNVEIQYPFCVKRENDKDPSCSNKETITTQQLSKQAAYVPVTVEKIEKTANHLGDNLYFIDLKITFRNLGGGTISNPSAITSGYATGQIIEQPTIIVGRDQLSGKNCSPNKLVFENDIAVLNCFVELPVSTETFASYPLTIGYSFGYKMRIKAGPIPLVFIDRKTGNDDKSGQSGEEPTSGLAGGSQLRKT